MMIETLIEEIENKLTASLEDMNRAQISGRKAPGLTQGSSPLLYNKCGDEPGVCSPEMWAQV
jgi:hypothetical protein